MKIIIVGYGQMGRIVEQVATGRGHEIVAKVDPVTGDLGLLNDILDKEFDVCIDFSLPDTAIDNIKFYAKNNIKAIVGTTGWYDHKEEVKLMFADSDGALLWAANFSIGVYIFYEIVKSASKIINDFDSYDVFGHEFHHNIKADSPSGTAVSLSNIVLENIDRKKRVVTSELKRRIEPDEFHFSSTRGGKVPGTHSIYFDSSFDTIELKHTARTKEGFVIGAVLGAEWLINKQGYYEIDDFVREIIK